jgi:hypothetical protein
VTDNDMDFSPDPDLDTDVRAGDRDPQAPVGKGYFITCRRDDGAWVALSGPYVRHSYARAALPDARRYAAKVDPRAHWYAYGTACAPSRTAVVFPDDWDAEVGR